MKAYEPAHHAPATHPKMSAHGLDRLALMAGAQTRFYIATNPATGADTVNRLCTDPDRYVAGHALARTTDPGLLEEAAAGGVRYRQRGAAANPSVAPATVERLISARDRPTSIALLENPSVTDDQADTIMADQDWFANPTPSIPSDVTAAATAHPGIATYLVGRNGPIDRGLAAVRGLGDAIYETLHRRNHIGVRALLERNPDASDDLFIDDPSGRYRHARSWFTDMDAAVAANPSDPRVLAAAFVSPAVARAVALHPSMDPQVLDVTFVATKRVHPDPRVRRALGRRYRWQALGRSGLTGITSRQLEVWQLLAPSIPKGVANTGGSANTFDNWESFSSSLGNDTQAWDVLWSLLPDIDPSFVALYADVAVRTSQQD